MNSEVDASVVLKKMQDRVGELITTVAILEARLEAAEASVQIEQPVVNGNVVNNATPQVVAPEVAAPEVVTAEVVNPQPVQDNAPQLPDMPSDVYVPPSA